MLELIRAASELPDKLLPKKKRLNVIKGDREYYWEVEQNTPEWDQLRMGKFTASKADVFLVNGKRSDNLGAGALTYINEVTCESLFNIKDENYQSAFMEAGHIKESFAAAAVKKRYPELEFEEIGFVRFIKSFGCSPDLISTIEAFGAEIKSPNINTHFSYLSNTKLLIKKYYAQCQYSMWVTGCDKWYLFSYNPAYPEKFQLIEELIDRDPEMMALFNTKMQSAIELQIAITKTL